MSASSSSRGSRADFAAPAIVYQLGLPPGRIDILTSLTGVAFAEAWPDRVSQPMGDVTESFIGRRALIRNEQATQRANDLGDIEDLE